MKTILIAATAALALTGCLRDAELADSRQTRRMQAEARSQVGMPRIQAFTEKRLATKLSELRDRPNLLTYTYTQGLDGRFRCLGRSIGFGLPYSTQVTNPMQGEGLPQAEPNGLYMPDSAEASWVMLIDPKGEAQPVYVESSLTVSVFPLTGPAVADPCPA